MGFIRNTLKSKNGTGLYKCDLVIGVPGKFELADTTQAYYASTYTFVYAEGRGMDELHIAEDIMKISAKNLQQIRIGVFDRGPGQFWIHQHDLFAIAVPYVAQTGSFTVNPINILDDIVNNEIDATIIGGPIAGYYLKKSNEHNLRVLPLESSRHNPQMKFDYQIAMAVRFGEQKWKQKIVELIKKNKEAIDTILDDFGIPRIPLLQKQ
jgi:mxaJ protein